MHRSLLASRALAERNLLPVIAKKKHVSAKFYASTKSSEQRRDTASDADIAKLSSWFADPSPPEELSALDSLPPAESSHTVRSLMIKEPSSAEAISRPAKTASDRFGSVRIRKYLGSDVSPSDSFQRVRSSIMSPAPSSTDATSSSKKMPSDLTSNSVNTVSIRKHLARNSPQMPQPLSMELEQDSTESPGLIRKHLVRNSRRMLQGLSMELQRASTVEEVRRLREEDRQNGATAALVPTMGALHKGHLELIKQAAQVCDNVYVSIYVNPTQFGPTEDLETYPRTMDADMRKLNEMNEELARIGRGMITCVFTPKTSEIYPIGLSNTSHVIMNPEVTQILEGKARPTFFQGVTTVVMKLLNIVQPDCVFFGQKDIQQLVIIQRMVKEFHLNTQVYRCPTERLVSGLAMSSRNAYLGERRRETAQILFSALRGARDSFNTDAQSRSRSRVLDCALQTFKMAQDRQREMLPKYRARFQVDYLSLADPVTLKEVEWVGDQGAIVSGAIVMLPLEDIQPGEELGIDNDANNVRLIDNMLLGELWSANTAVHQPFSVNVKDGPSYAV